MKEDSVSLVDEASSDDSEEVEESTEMDTESNLASKRLAIKKKFAQKMKAEQKEKRRLARERQRERTRAQAQQTTEEKKNFKAAVRKRAPKAMVDILPDCINDQDAFLTEMLSQVAYDIDQMTLCFEKKTKDDPSMVASRRINAITKMTELHEKLMHLRGGSGAMTVQKALATILDGLQEAAQGLLSDDQYNLLLDNLQKTLNKK